MKVIVTLSAALLMVATGHAQVTQTSHGANSPNINGVKNANLGTDKPTSVEELKQQLAAEHRKAILSDLDAHISDTTATDLQAQSLQQQAQQKVQAVRALIENDRVELGYPEGSTYDFQHHTYVPPAPKPEPAKK